MSLRHVVTGFVLIISISQPLSAQLTTPSLEEPNRTSIEHIWVSGALLKVCHNHQLDPVPVLVITALGKELLVDMMVSRSKPDILDALFMILPGVLFRGQENQIVFGQSANLAYNFQKRLEIEFSLMRVRLTRRIFFKNEFLVSTNENFYWGMSINWRSDRFFFGSGVNVTRIVTEGFVHGRAEFGPKVLFGAIL